MPNINVQNHDKFIYINQQPSVKWKSVSILFVSSVQLIRVPNYLRTYDGQNVRKQCEQTKQSIFIDI